MADAELLRRLRAEGGQAGEQLLLTGTRGQLHPGDDTQAPSPELLVDRPEVPTSCAMEPGCPVASAAAHQLRLGRIRKAQSDRWQRLQGALDAVRQRGQHRSAAKAWPTVQGWMAAFQEAACNWPWMEDPSSARMVASAEDYAMCCAAVEAARQEMWLPPGWTIPDAPPVLRIEEVLGASSTPLCETGGRRPRTEQELRPGDRFTELWISPRVPEKEVLRLVRHAQVGVHLVAMAG